MLNILLISKFGITFALSYLVLNRCTNILFEFYTFTQLMFFNHFFL